MLIRDPDMNIRRIAALLLGLIVIVFSNTLVIGSDRHPAVATPQSGVSFTATQREIVRQLQAATVIYLGEIQIGSSK
jgi:hypothetical protein